jgi:CheY-like chemotaxis protein
MFPALAPSGPKNVLVLEDDDDVREEIIGALERHGYLACGARDGREGLELMRRTVPRPSVILLDWMMPVMDGMGFLGHQASDPRFSSIPVVVVSAVANMTRIPTLCVSAVLGKPVRVRTLIEVVDRMAGVGPRGGDGGGGGSALDTWQTSDTDVGRRNAQQRTASPCDAATVRRARAVTLPDTPHAFEAHPGEAPRMIRARQVTADAPIAGE